MGIFFSISRVFRTHVPRTINTFLRFSLLQSDPPDLNYLISHCIPTFVWIGLLVQLEKALVLGVTLIDKRLWPQKWRYF